MNQPRASIAGVRVFGRPVNSRSTPAATSTAFVTARFNPCANNRGQSGGLEKADFGGGTHRISSPPPAMPNARNSVGMPFSRK